MLDRCSRENSTESAPLGSWSWTTVPSWSEYARESARQFVPDLTLSDGETSLDWRADPEVKVGSPDRDWRQRKNWYVAAAPSEPVERAFLLSLILCCRPNQKRALLSELAFVLMISLAGAARVRPGKGGNGGDRRKQSQQFDGEHDSIDAGEQDVDCHSPNLSVFGRLAPLPMLSSTAGSAITGDTSGFVSALSFDAALAAANARSWLRQVPSPAGTLRSARSNSERNSHSQEIAVIAEDNVMTDKGDNGAPKYFDCTPAGHTSARTSFAEPLTFRISGEHSLNSIAEEIFHDADLGWLIADINKGSLREYWLDGKRIIRIKDRQDILLPDWRDLLKFYQLRAPVARAENLVTIVEKGRVDVERVNTAFSGVINARFPI